MDKIDTFAKLHDALNEIAARIKPGLFIDNFQSNSGESYDSQALSYDVTFCYESRDGQTLFLCYTPDDSVYAETEH